jgi:ATP-dependent DNA helicase HFM1/MER3
MSASSAPIRVADVIDPRFRSVFAHAEFNNMQSEVLRQCLDSDSNIIVAAPTGSGKTVLHELALIQLLLKKDRERTGIKAVFIAPSKALCQQRARDWRNKFGRMGYVIAEVTGDADNKNSLRSINQATIIITTPEKWDSLTRCWKDHIYLLGAVDLLLIDEVHLLGDERGSTLETLVVRMQMLSRYSQKRLQDTNPGEEVIHIFYILYRSKDISLGDADHAR